MADKVIYTADNEEPDCMKCDHVCGWTWTDRTGKLHDYCSEKCGAEHYWNGYERTESEDEE